MNPEAIQLAGLVMLLRALPREHQDDDNIVMEDGTLVPFESAASHLKQVITTHLQSASIDTFDFHAFINDNYGHDLDIDADSTPAKGIEQFVGSFLPGGN